MKFTFDLYKLHKEEDDIPRKWICAIGKNLNLKIDEIINEVVEKKGKIIVCVKIDNGLMQSIYSKAIVKARSQEELAKVLGITRQSLYSYRTCLNRIPLPIFTNFVNFIGEDYNSFSFKRCRYIRGLSRQKIAKIIAKNLNVRLNFVEKIIYQKRPEIAIIFILELLSFWQKALNKSDRELSIKKNGLQETFEFFKQNQIKSKKIRAFKKLNVMLSKIIGAMLADGCVFARDNALFLLDEDEVSVRLFSKWIRDLFAVDSNVRKNRKFNAWQVKICNKPLQRYFTEFFGFDKGKKRLGYDFPSIVKLSNFNIKKACSIGVIIFDGVVRTNGEIGLNIGSKNLRDSVSDVLILDGINITKSNKSDITGMWKLYSSGIKSEKQYENWLEYFAKGSDKWYRIYEMIIGFQGKVSDSCHVSFILEKCFSKKSASKVTLSSIFNLFLSYNTLTVAQLLSLFLRKGINLNESTLWNYTRILRKMNLIIKKRLRDNTNLYVYNRDVTSWKLPYRPDLSPYYV